MGLAVPEECLLCNAGSENRQHLFSDCSFSHEVWSFFLSQLHLNALVGFDDCLRWLKDHTRDRNIALITKLLFQTSIYAIWKERNAKLHNNIPRPAHSIISEIKHQIRLRLDLLSRAQEVPFGGATLLLTWFNFF